MARSKKLGSKSMSSKRKSTSQKSGSAKKRKSTSSGSYKRIPNVVRNKFTVYQTVEGDPKGQYKKACDLVCIRCLYRKRNQQGPRCKNIVCFGLPYCTEHMKIMYNLELKPFASNPNDWSADLDPQGFYKPSFNKQYDPLNFRVFAIDEVPADSGKDNTKQIVFQAGEIIISNDDSDVERILRKELNYAGKIGGGRLSESVNPPGAIESEAGAAADFTCVRSVVSLIRQGIDDGAGNFTWNVKFIQESENGSVPGGLGIVAVRDIFHGEELLLEPLDYTAWGDPRSAQYLPDKQAGYAIIRNRGGRPLPDVLPSGKVRGWGVSTVHRKDKKMKFESESGSDSDSGDSELDEQKMSAAFSARASRTKTDAVQPMATGELSSSDESSSLSDLSSSDEESGSEEEEEPSPSDFRSSMLASRSGKGELQEFVASRSGNAQSSLPLNRSIRQRSFYPGSSGQMDSGQGVQSQGGPGNLFGGNGSSAGQQSMSIEDLV